jgi:hypothetical protein
MRGDAVFPPCVARQSLQGTCGQLGLWLHKGEVERFDKHNLILQYFKEEVVRGCGWGVSQIRMSHQRP